MGGLSQEPTSMCLYGPGGDPKRAASILLPVTRLNIQGTSSRVPYRIEHVLRLRRALLRQHEILLTTLAPAVRP